MDYRYDNITISGLPGAGSTTLGKKIAEIMEWDFFVGGDFMRMYAIKQGLFDEKNGLHHDATVYTDDFDREVDFGMRQTLRDKKGNVLDAWLSGFMAQQVEGTLKVLLYCSDDAVRVDRIVNRDKISVEEAKQHIFERKQKNLDKWRRMYAGEWQKWVVEPGTVSEEEEIDFWDPRLYDLAIDTFSQSKEQTLQTVLQELGYHQDDSGETVLVADA